MNYDDKSIRDALKELEADFTEKEAEFIESILYEHPQGITISTTSFLGLRYIG